MAAMFPTIRNRFKIFLVVLFIAMGVIGYAQTLTIHGRVIDSKTNIELPNANAGLSFKDDDSETDIFSFYGDPLETPRVTNELSLSVLCKVWGLLKYFHPQVKNGSINWDSVLLKQIPLFNNRKFFCQ